MLAAECAFRNIPNRLYDGDDQNEAIWLRALLKIFEDSEGVEERPFKL